MKFGLFFVNTGMGSSGSGAKELARRAEDCGFESLWTVEHVVVPSGYESKYPYAADGKMAGGAEEFDIPDPLIWLSYVAAVTERIRLATGILILPQRNPLVAAKEIASLDALSGGRVVLGVGVGWLREEFDALGVPFEGRGKRLDSYVEAMRALWRDDKATVHNDFASFDNCISRPRPPAKAVPIVIGGHTQAAARRAARFGDGFFPGNSSPDELAGIVQAMRDHCGTINRDPNEIELTAGGGARTFDDLAAQVERAQALGFSRLVLPPLPGDRLNELADSLRDRFGMEV